MSNFPPAEPHGPIEEIFTDVYWVTGSVQFKPLVRLPRNMIILRNGEELTLVNAVRLNEEGEAALAKLGTVKHVIKIGFHGMDNAYYIDRYGAKCWAVPREGETGDVELAEDTELPIPDARVFMFRDTKLPEAALLLEREGGLLITCDSIQHWAPHKLMSGAAKLITRIMGFRFPAQIGPPWRGVQTPEGGSLKADFGRLAQLPFSHIVGGHGGLLKNDGQARLAETMTRVFG